MKRLLFTGIATVAFALGAFAQGSIDLDNSAGTYGFCLNGPGQANWYAQGQPLGIEVWELNASTLPANINGKGNIAAYGALASDGFKLEATLAGLTTTYPASIVYGTVNMADVSPAGGTVVVGLAAWNTTAASWSAMVSSANANTRAGVIAFVNPTANYLATPTPTPPGIDGLPAGQGWDGSAGQDLVMTAVPEPSTFALAGLGAAALLIFRRRK